MKLLFKSITYGLLYAGTSIYAGSTFSADSMNAIMAMDPAKAEIVAIDRFSETVGHLQVRTKSNGLPGPNQPVDFDQGPFITQGFAPDGSVVRYYNFDVQSTTPAQIYVLYRENEHKPVNDQLDIIDTIPGDEGYNDFWLVNKVMVPKDYKANTATSVADIKHANYKIEKTDKVVNYPVVPDGSKARLRFNKGDIHLHSAWYRGMIAKYFEFDEKELSTGGSDIVPVSPIYVTFNNNPDQPNGGPGSGFKTEPKSAQTHNVPTTIPTDMGYSPLWLVNVYDNADWSMVHNLSTVAQAKVLAPAVATVNCPIVYLDKKEMMKM